MFGKISFLFLTIFAAQGHCVSEIWLEESNVVYIQSIAFRINRAWSDTLLECHLIVPDGTIYEVYPNNNLPPHILLLEATQPLTACGVGMRGMGVEHDGTYELLSLVRHPDNSQTVTRQRNNLYVRTIDLFPHKS